MFQSVDTSGLHNTKRRALGSPRELWGPHKKSEGWYNIKQSNPREIVIFASLHKFQLDLQKLQIRIPWEPRGSSIEFADIGWRGHAPGYVPRATQ